MKTTTIRHLLTVIHCSYLRLSRQFSDNVIRTNFYYHRPWHRYCPLCLFTNLNCMQRQPSHSTRLPNLRLSTENGIGLPLVTKWCFIPRDHILINFFLWISSSLRLSLKKGDRCITTLTGWFLFWQEHGEER